MGDLNELRIYAISMMMCREGRDDQGSISVWYTMPAILFAPSLADANRQALKKALDTYTEDEGYSHHTTSAIEVTAEFLSLASSLPKLPENDRRHGEGGTSGAGANTITEEEILSDTDSTM